MQISLEYTRKLFSYTKEHSKKKKKKKITHGKSDH